MATANKKVSVVKKARVSKDNTHFVVLKRGLFSWKVVEIWSTRVLANAAAERYESVGGTYKVEPGKLIR